MQKNVYKLITYYMVQQIDLQCVHLNGLCNM